MAAICRWGNSLGIRLPQAVAQAAGLHAGVEIGVRLLDNGCVLVTPCKSKVVANEVHAPTKEMAIKTKW